MIKTVCLSLVLTVGLVTSAQAQYDGGSGGTGTASGGYGGGSTAAIVAGAAAAVGLVAAVALTHQTHVVGCVSETPQGFQIVSEKNKKTYLVEPQQNLSLKSGTRVEISGKTSKQGTTETFKAKKLVKEIGACEAPGTAGAFSQ